MSAVDQYDVDAFAVLDSPHPQEDSTPAEIPVMKEEVTYRTSTSASGGGAVGIGRDLDQSYGKTEIRDSIVLLKDGAEQFAQVGVQERKGRGLQDREALQRLAATYVPPPGLLDVPIDGESETAFETLRRRRVLLIGAQEIDCGQFAAAQRLGYELQERHSELVVREELSDPDFRLRADALFVEQEPAVVLVDLRRSSQDDLLEVQRDLVELTQQIERYRSYLILLVPPDHMSRFEKQLPERMHMLGKPSSVEVFECHLVGEDARALVERTESASGLESLWPPKVAELAEAVSNRSKHGDDPERVFRDLLDNELHGRTDELRAKIHQRQVTGNSEWIALLLAASALESASTEHIVAASDRMLEYNRAEVEQSVPLLRLSPFTRLRGLDDENFDVGSREFRPPGFGAQVLRHFWREHPDLRKPMLDWIGKLPGEIRDFERHELELLVDRVADLAGVGGAELPLRLARKWSMTKAGRESGGAQTSNSASDRSRRSIAVRLLTTTATDLFLGKSVRQRLWAWSREGSADLQLVTAEVCAGIGHSFPRVALTRLKHLANAENGLVRESVREAVQQIGIQLGGSQFLRYLSEWFDGASPARLRLLSEAVAEVLREQNGEVDAQLATSFWQRALGAMPPEDSRTIVQSWLRAASAVSPAQRDSMVESLVQATSCDSIRIAQVEHASRIERASLDLSSLRDDSLTSVVHQLWTRLDEVDPVWR
ncbi:hypothetical protein [Actinopolyspora lacussalsi]